MGIPSFSKRLLKSNRSISKKPDVIDNLYIDYNGMIHPSSHKVVQEIIESGKKYTSTEVTDRIITMCIKDLKNLIDFVKPTKSTFVAIDGVAPFAKLNQQRLRRFKSYSETTKIFDSCSITPGTPFMKKLQKALLALKISNVTFSFSDVPSEGEHKIMNRIRQELSENKQSIQPTRCVMGLDADLIMLTIALRLENLYILREEQDEQLIKTFGNWNYLSVEYITNIITKDIEERTNRTYTPEQFDCVIADYILICFFGGNDFLPHLPSCIIGCGGLDYFINSYFEYLKNGNDFLTKNSRINFNNLAKFLRKMLQVESKMAKNNINTLQKRCSDIKDIIGYKEPSWESRHYSHYFHLENLTKYGQMTMINDKDIFSITKEYIKTLEWVLVYYYGKCVDYRHYYQEHATPTIKAILFQLETLQNTVFESRPFCTEYEQLMCVLPPSSIKLVPLKYRKLMTSSDSQLAMYYPKKISFDTSYCSEEWQYKSVFLPVDFQEIIDKMAELI
jgi:5'-3' exonuclease